MDLRYYVIFPLSAGLAYHLYKKKYSGRVHDEEREQLHTTDFLHQGSTSQRLSPLQRHQTSLAVNDHTIRDDQQLKIERFLADREEKFHNIAPSNRGRHII